ncbi:hypothetical protein B4U37_13050 [Sutcliffiella horikoshii]|uniref:Uncharacterized protein n=1 Tax=Sutcliffiella horikoshii TaxID=79883 RepID=A0ABM6KKH1_9BACI|nr:hypothetical protein B4U37_13050 [Sutcliffiella horikoshii]
MREIALGGYHTGEAEEAPAAPLGKRSHLRKSTAVSYKNRSKYVYNLFGKAYKNPYNPKWTSLILKLHIKPKEIITK